MLGFAPLAELSLAETAQILWATLAVALPADTAAFAGLATNPGAGAFAIVLPADAPAFHGAIGVTGVFAITEPADAVAFSGTRGVSGTFAVALPADVAAFSEAVAIKGSFAIVLPADVAAFAGVTGKAAGKQILFARRVLVGDDLVGGAGANAPTSRKLKARAVLTVDDLEAP